MKKIVIIEIDNLFAWFKALFVGSNNTLDYAIIEANRKDVLYGLKRLIMRRGYNVRFRKVTYGHLRPYSLKLNILDVSNIYYDQLLTLERITVDWILGYLMEYEEKQTKK